MPLYAFACPECGEFDLHRPVDERNDPVTCPAGHPARRILSADVGWRIGRAGFLKGVKGLPINAPGTVAGKGTNTRKLVKP